MNIDKMIDLAENHNKVDTRIHCSVCGGLHDISELQRAPQLEAYMRQVAIAILNDAELPKYNGERNDNFYCGECYEKAFGKREW